MMADPKPLPNNANTSIIMVLASLVIYFQSLYELPHF